MSIPESLRQHTMWPWAGSRCPHLCNSNGKGLPTSSEQVCTAAKPMSEEWFLPSVKRRGHSRGRLVCPGSLQVNRDLNTFWRFSRAGTGKAAHGHEEPQAVRAPAFSEAVWHTEEAESPLLGKAPVVPRQSIESSCEKAETQTLLSPWSLLRAGPCGRPRLASGPCGSLLRLG